METEHINRSLSDGALRGAPRLLDALRDAGIETLDALSSQALGAAVTTHRTSWVRSAKLGTIEVYIKTYDYPTRGDRWRGIGRTTVLAPSRARRERDALVWLRSHGFPAAEPLAVGERRVCGVLRRAVIVTEAWPGRSVEDLLCELDAGASGALVDAVVHQVRSWHRAGFRDRNLDPRNLLARRGGDGAWIVAKIDSPRHRIAPPGRACDRLARADWRRLDDGLRVLGHGLPSPPRDAS